MTARTMLGKSSAGHFDQEPSHVTPFSTAALQVSSAHRAPKRKRTSADAPSGSKPIFWKQRPEILELFKPRRWQFVRDDIMHTFRRK